MESLLMLIGYDQDICMIPYKKGNDYITLFYNGCKLHLNFA